MALKESSVLFLHKWQLGELRAGIALLVLIQMLTQMVSEEACQ